MFSALCGPFSTSFDATTSFLTLVGEIFPGLLNWQAFFKGEGANFATFFRQTYFCPGGYSLIFHEIQFAVVRPWAFWRSGDVTWKKAWKHTMSWSEGSVVHINRDNAMQFNKREKKRKKERKERKKKRKWKSDLHSVQVPTNIQQIILNAVFCQSMSFWDSVPGIRLICCLFGQFFVYNDICRTYPSTKKALSLNCHDRRSASLMSVVSSHKWKSLGRICNPSHPSSIIILLLILLLIAMVIMVRGVLTQQASPRQFWNDIGKLAWQFTFSGKKIFSSQK